MGKVDLKAISLCCSKVEFGSQALTTSNLKPGRSRALTETCIFLFICICRVRSSSCSGGLIRRIKWEKVCESSAAQCRTCSGRPGCGGWDSWILKPISFHCIGFIRCKSSHHFPPFPHKEISWNCNFLNIFLPSAVIFWLSLQLVNMLIQAKLGSSSLLLF